MIFFVLLILLIKTFIAPTWAMPRLGLKVDAEKGIWALLVEAAKIIKIIMAFGLFLPWCHTQPLYILTTRSLGQHV